MTFLRILSRISNFIRGRPIASAIIAHLYLENKQLKQQIYYLQKIILTMENPTPQPTIHVAGDYVLQKHVEQQNTIDKVEAGGIGFQIVQSAKSSLQRPKENDYNAVREYIEKRKEQDEVFKSFCKSHTRKQVCEFLSMEFGWTVQSHHLGVNMGRN